MPSTQHHHKITRKELKQPDEFMSFVGNTIASTLANEFSEATEPLYVSSLVALGLVLYIITYLVQVGSQKMLRRMYRAWSVGL